LLLDDNKDALAQAVYNDLRKPRNEFILGEILTTLEDINHSLEHLDKWTKDEYTTPSFINRVGTTCHMRKEPKGENTKTNILTGNTTITKKLGRSK